MKKKQPKMDPDLNWIFEFFKEKIEDIERLLILIKHKETKMAQTLQDLQAAIAEIRRLVKEDTAQDVKVVEAIEALLAAIEASGNKDFEEEVKALSEAGAELSGDNAAVQAAIDKAVPPTTPV